MLMPVSLEKEAALIDGARTAPEKPLDIVVSFSLHSHLNSKTMSWAEQVRLVRLLSVVVF